MHSVLCFRHLCLFLPPFLPPELFLRTSLHSRCPPFLQRSKFPNVKRTSFPLCRLSFLDETDSSLFLSVYNATAAEDLITRPDPLSKTPGALRVAGAVTNYTLVTLAHGLQSYVSFSFFPFFFLTHRLIFTGSSVGAWVRAAPFTPFSTDFHRTFAILRKKTPS
jgi:hypothetical protein